MGLLFSFDNKRRHTNLGHGADVLVGCWLNLSEELTDQVLQIVFAVASNFLFFTLIYSVNTQADSIDNHQLDSVPECNPVVKCVGSVRIDLRADLDEVNDIEDVSD